MIGDALLKTIVQANERWSRLYSRIFEVGMSQDWIHYTCLAPTHLELVTPVTVTKLGAHETFKLPSQAKGETQKSLRVVSLQSLHLGYSILLFN